MTNVERDHLPRISLATPRGARAEVYSHGAHVTSWIPASGTERLFLSARSAFGASSAIRGGVPVIFPQFANQGPLPKHGFARTSTWRVVDADPANASRAVFQLSSSPSTLAMWPHEFLAELSMALTDTELTVTLSVVNPGTEPFTFTAALHTYLRVDDVRAVVVRGLAGRTYRDAAAGGLARREESSDVAISGEVDRIYVDVSSPIEVVEGDRTTEIAMTGFKDVVVWNPGPALSAKLSDMEPDGYLRMLCVEAAGIATPLVVPPGARWSGSQRLRAL